MMYLLMFIGIVSAVLFLFHLKIRLSYLYRHIMRQFPGPKCVPLFGNALYFAFCNSHTFYKQLQNICDSYERFIRIWMGPSVTVFLYKVEDVEILLSSSEITKSLDYYYLHEWIGTGLLTSTGSKWKNRRKIITPTFHFKILEDFLIIFNQNGQLLIKKLAEKVGKGSFNAYDLIKLYALDNICETALGVTVKAQEDSESEYTKAVKDISAMIFEKGFKVWLWNDFLFGLTNYGKRYKKALKVLHETTLNVIKERRLKLEQENFDFSGGKNLSEIGQKKKLAFLDLLLLSDEMSDADIKEEVDTFMFEGHDTVTSGISFAIYCLAHNKDVQDAIYKEQIEIFGDSDRDPTLQDLKEMKYLEMVLKESQRLYPSVPFYGRHLENDLKIHDGYFLPKGCQAYVNAAKLHRDPQIWPNPNVFDPNNFSPENIKSRNPYSFVPFSAGPRNCIGQKFAMMEMKSCIGKAIRKYKFLPTSDDSKHIDLAATMILFSANGINIEVELRR